MLTKYLLAGVAGSMLLASSAFAAEETTTKTPAPATTAAASNTSFHGDWRASKVVGLNVYNEKNENVGSINDLLMDKSGNVKAAVISVGGFLGIGTHDVGVKFSELKWEMEPVKSTTTSSNPPAGSANRPAGTVGTGNANNANANNQPKQFWPDHAVLANASKDELKNRPQFDATK